MLELLISLKSLLLTLLATLSVMSPVISRTPPPKEELFLGGIETNPIYQIDEIAKEKTGPLVLVRVSFWVTKDDYNLGNPPEFMNDFRMMLFPSSTNMIFDTEGKVKTKSGEYVLLEELKADDPPLLETISRDNIKDIRENIMAYWKEYQSRKNTLNPFPADGRDLRIEIIKNDLSGVMNKSEVRALKGTAFEIIQ